MPPWAGAWAASVVAGADVGAMAAALLADPTLVTERTLIAGAAVRLDHAGIARVLTEVTGRPVRYQELAPEQWRDELIAGAEATGDANPRGAAHLAAQSVTLRVRPLPPLTDHVGFGTGCVSAGRYRAAHGAGSRRANPAWCAAR
ncbi:MAG: hypothetical protein QOC75_2383 [Pseudonocardiales bacterium]|nr:hypothetical protein [Pseudonocardiales bacterium]